MSPNSTHHHQALVAEFARKSGEITTPRCRGASSASGVTGMLAASTIIAAATCYVDTELTTFVGDQQIFHKRWRFAAPRDMT
jgi:hypothetical protein